MNGKAGQSKGVDMKVGGSFISVSGSGWSLLRGQGSEGCKGYAFKPNAFFLLNFKAFPSTPFFSYHDKKNRAFSEFSHKKGMVDNVPPMEGYVPGYYYPHEFI